MKAQVRFATPSEKRGFFRQIVFVVAGHVVFYYRSWRGLVTDSNDQFLWRRPFVYSDGDFLFPDGTSLIIRYDGEDVLFNGERLKEEWLTPMLRRWSVGDSGIEIRFEDDSLCLDFDGDRPPMNVAVMAFYLFSGEASGGGTLT
jgi:hypothetical protein